MIHKLSISIELRNKLIDLKSEITQTLVKSELTKQQITVVLLDILSIIQENIIEIKYKEGETSPPKSDENKNV